MEQERNVKWILEEKIVKVRTRVQLASTITALRRKEAPSMCISCSLIN